MSDIQSKLPNLKEITAMANKLFKDVKESVCEIMTDYKNKREQTETNTKSPVEEKIQIIQVDKDKESVSSNQVQPDMIVKDISITEEIKKNNQDKASK